LILAMLLTERLVARETGRASVGLAAMVAIGYTSLLKSSATWYSSGQTLWAALGVLAMLLALQGWRRSGGWWRLALAALSTAAAGGFWTVGHAAGPVGAVYLWSDGRRRCRVAAVVPIAATLAAAGFGLLVGGGRINATISFHGRTSRQAVDPISGMSHTLQAIPETLVLGNLGLTGETTPEQGAALCLALVGLWAWSRRRAGTVSQSWMLAIEYAVVALSGLLAALRLRPESTTAIICLAFIALGWIVVSERGTPLERAGAATVLISYLIEWSFRGYLPFSSLRGVVVPWYDTIPHIGAVLFVAGWWANARSLPTAVAPAPPARAEILVIIALAAGMLIVHQPRVDALFIADVATPTPDERRAFPTTRLQKLRADYLAAEYARWQGRHLRRLDRAQATARRLGIGREGIAQAFGRVDIPELPKVYDAAPMLDLPWRGTETDAAVIRRALAPDFAKKPEPVIPLAALRAAARPG
jgi:hypothetical protein